MQTKTFQTTRSLTYSYLFTKPTNPSLPTLLFVHGFPSTHRDWNAQTSFFASKGYGIMCPDMLGYGASDRPLDVTLFKHRDLAHDLVEILEKEHAGDVVAIGHDWGSGTVSKLVTYHQDRFLGFAFTAVAYRPPRPTPPLDVMIGHLKQTFGSELLGYWKFMIKDGADQEIKQNTEAFVSILFPENPELWKEYIATTGGIDRWVLEKKMGALPSYLTQEEFDVRVAEFKKDGLKSALNYYHAAASGLENDDDVAVRERNRLVKPSFFAAATLDFVCLASMGKHSFMENADSATIVDFDTDHWVQLAQPDKFNSELEKWITGKVLNQTSLL